MSWPHEVKVVAIDCICNDRFSDRTSDQLRPFERISVSSRLARPTCIFARTREGYGIVGNGSRVEHAVVGVPGYHHVTIRERRDALSGHVAL